MSRMTGRMITVSAAALFSTTAEAHHAMGSGTPATLAEGLISGFAHPVIGLDHLAVIIAAGLIAGVLGLGRTLPVAFIGASLGGVGLHLLALDLPGAELVIATSAVGIGTMLALGRAGFGQRAWYALYAGAGIFHGYAYGESIVGAEATPLWAYLAGLAIVQSLIAIGVARLAKHREWVATTLEPRLAGAAVFGIGLTAVLAQVIPG